MLRMKIKKDKDHLSSTQWFFQLQGENQTLNLIKKTLIEQFLDNTYKKWKVPSLKYLGILN